MIGWFFLGLFAGLLLGMIGWNLIVEWIEGADPADRERYRLRRGGPLDSLWDDWERRK